MPLCAKPRAKPRLDNTSRPGAYLKESKARRAKAQVTVRRGDDEGYCSGTWAQVPGRRGATSPPPYVETILQEIPEVSAHGD